jgi:catechol 2,3-dioxygenase-like lactoylglutathione lyase family enzyme
MEGLLGIERWRHTAIRVSDLDRSRQWYEQMLGFQVVGGRSKTAVEGLMAGVAFELQAVEPDEGPGDIVGFALSVNDLDRAHGVARRQGIDGGPIQPSSPTERSLIIQDPDGLQIRLVEQAAPSASAPIEAGLFEVSHWLYIQVRVLDAERSIAWYEQMLGFRMVNDLRFDGPVYEASTGIQGVRIRLTQGFVGGVSMELVHLTSDVPDVAQKIASGGSIPAFTIGVRDVVSCFELATEHGVVVEGPPASFPPTPYHSMFIHDPDGTRIDLCDFEALTP